MEDNLFALCVSFLSKLELYSWIYQFWFHSIACILIHQFLPVLKFSQLFPLALDPALHDFGFFGSPQVFDNLVHNFTIRILKYMVHSMLIKYCSVTWCYCDCKNDKQFVGQQLLPLFWLKKNNNDMNSNGKHLKCWMTKQ